jgi:hypothetical protein
MPAAPAAPVAEGKDTAEKEDKKNTRSQALMKSLTMAKKAGATLETKVDFGSGTKSIAEIIDECGMQPQDVGFEQEDPTQAMIKYVSGFWNREEGNFPLGGERVKIKVKKEFEDGQFGNADPQALARVLAFIDKKDPGAAQGQQHDILRLAGVGSGDRAMDENPEDAQMAKLNDLMAQFNNIKLKVGNDEIDFNNPDQAGEKIKGIMGGMMKGVQGQVPNQNIQFPGGQMNPADMMKGIMDKINFGK